MITLLTNSNSPHPNSKLLELLDLWSLYRKPPTPRTINKIQKYFTSGYFL